jgi:hypothetical protein
VSSRDTTPDAMAVQTAIYRRMTSDQYSSHQVRMALFRLLLGDELFHRAWPAEPLRAP